MIVSRAMSGACSRREFPLTSLPCRLLPVLILAFAGNMLVPLCLIFSPVRRLRTVIVVPAAEHVAV